MLKNVPIPPALPSDFDEANRVASELDRSLNLQKVTYRACEDSANKASAALHEAQVSESVLAARIRDACGNRDAAVADLAQAREVATDEALAGALALAQQRTDKARESLEDSEARLNTQDRDSLRGLLENAGEATKRAIDHLQSNQDDQNRLRISLDLRGEQGLHTDRAEALDCLRHVEREHESTKARAEAVRLLYDTFAKHRQRARQRYLEPFKARIDQLGRIVFGSTFAVELNDDLGIARCTRDGITLDANQLSTGAREQLGVISRLACAAIVSVDDGGAPGHDRRCSRMERPAAPPKHGCRDRRCGKAMSSDRAYVHSGTLLQCRPSKGNYSGPLDAGPGRDLPAARRKESWTHD